MYILGANMYILGAVDSDSFCTFFSESAGGSRAWLYYLNAIVKVIIIIKQC